MENNQVLITWVILGTMFLVVDTHFIVDGRYMMMNNDDYVLASMKLFADYCLIWIAIVKSCD